MSREHTAIMFKSAVELPGEEFWARAFRCVMCKEILTLKIFYCEKGHFVCHRCTKCDCGAKATKLQATFLENIVRKTKFMCELECGTLLSNDEYSYHVEEACRWRPVTCPKCTTVVDYKEYLHHLQRLHNILRIDLEDGSCSIRITKETPALQYTTFENQIFIIRWANNKLWVQSYERSSGVAIDIVGSDFKCTIKPSRLHAELYEADSVTLKQNDTARLMFSYTRTNGTASVSSTFQFSL